MSKPRYPWWGYVKNMIRRYPALKKEYADLHSPSVTANYTGMPRSGGVSRGVERLAIRDLPSTKQREYEAVRRAVEATEQYTNGRDRLKIVDLVLWKHSHTIEGAALDVPCGIATAWRWHQDFIRLVAGYYGLLDE